MVEDSELPEERGLACRTRALARASWRRRRRAAGRASRHAGRTPGAGRGSAMADSRPHQAELGVAGAPENRAEDPGAAGSLVRDYATVFKMMSPSYSGEGLTPLQCARLLPLATGVQFFWVVLFMIVELSAGAGGTSGVAGTRTVMLFFVYLLLIPIALLISRAAAAGSLRNSGLVRARESSAVVFVCIPGTGCMLACGYIHAPCTIHTGVRACVRACVRAQVLAYALVASSMLAAMLGSSMSTFGVEKCRGSATLGPLFPDVTSAVQTPVVQADSPAGSETGTGTGTGTAWLTETGTGTGTADEESEDTADEDSEDEADATSVVSGGLYMVGTVICLPVRLARTSLCASMPIAIVGLNGTDRRWMFAPVCQHWRAPVFVRAACPADV